MVKKMLSLIIMKTSKEIKYVDNILISLEFLSKHIIFFYLNFDI